MTRSGDEARFCAEIAEDGASPGIAWLLYAIADEPFYWVSDADVFVNARLVVEQICPKWLLICSVSLCR